VVVFATIYNGGLMEAQIIWSLIILGIWGGSLFIPFTLMSNTLNESEMDQRDKKSLDDATTGTHFLKR